MNRTVEKSATVVVWNYEDKVKQMMDMFYIEGFRQHMICQTMSEELDDVYTLLDCKMDKDITKPYFEQLHMLKLINTSIDVEPAFAEEIIKEYYKFNTSIYDISDKYKCSLVSIISVIDFKTCKEESMKQLEEYRESNLISRRNHGGEQL